MRVIQIVCSFPSRDSQDYLILVIMLLMAHQVMSVHPNRYGRLKIVQQFPKSLFSFSSLLVCCQFMIIVKIKKLLKSTPIISQPQLPMFSFKKLCLKVSHREYGSSSTSKNILKYYGSKGIVKPISQALPSYWQGQSNRRSLEDQVLSFSAIAL